MPTTSPLHLGLSKDRNYISVKERKVWAMIGIHMDKSVNVHKFRGSDVVLVMDCSGSMNDPIDPNQPTDKKLAKAIEGMWAAVRMLGPEDTFSVVAFSQSASVVVSRITASERESFFQTRRAQVEKELGSFGGMTNIYEGLKLAREQLGTQRDGFAQRIILLSDGAANLPTAPGSLLGPGNYPAKIAVELAEEYGKQGILVTSLGYGYGADMLPELLDQLAKSTGGNWLHVNTKLPPVTTLQNIFQDVHNVFASNVALTINVPTEVQITDIYRIEPVITYLGVPNLTATSRIFTLRANQLEMNKDYAWMIELEALPRAEEINLLSVGLSYTLSNGLMHSEQKNLSIHVTESSEKASERDRSYVAFIERARLNKFQKELSEAQKNNDSSRILSLLNQMIEHCRRIGLNMEADQYQRILIKFQADNNIARAALDAASTSTSASGNALDFQRKALSSNTPQSTPKRRPHRR